MRDYEDFSTEKADNSHFAVPSFYGKICREQYNEQPKYCDPGMPDPSGEMKGARRNEQKGP